MTELKKYRLIQGELTRVSEGNASTVFTEKGTEIYYTEDVASWIKEVIDEIIERGSGYKVSSSEAIRILESGFTNEKEEESQ